MEGQEKRVFDEMTQEELYECGGTFLNPVHTCGEMPSEEFYKFLEAFGKSDCVMFSGMTQKIHENDDGVILVDMENPKVAHHLLLSALKDGQLSDWGKYFKKQEEV